MKGLQKAGGGLREQISNGTSRKICSPGGRTTQQELWSQRRAGCLRRGSECWRSRKQTPTLPSHHGSASPQLNPSGVLVWEPKRWLCAQVRPWGRSRAEQVQESQLESGLGSQRRNSSTPGSRSSLPAACLHFSPDAVPQGIWDLVGTHPSSFTDSYRYSLSLITQLENAECRQCFRFSVQTQQCSA